MFRDLFLSEGGNGLGLCVRCLTFSVLHPSRITFPVSFRFLKAIRHCRICQLRSSKHFWDCGKHRKLYKNISSYFYLSSPPCSYIIPVAFRNSRATPLSFLVFRVWRSNSSDDLSTRIFSFPFLHSKGNEKRELLCFSRQNLSRS